MVIRVGTLSAIRKPGAITSNWLSTRVEQVARRFRSPPGRESSACSVLQPGKEGFIMRRRQTDIGDAELQTYRRELGARPATAHDCEGSACEVCREQREQREATQPALLPMSADPLKYVEIAHYHAFLSQLPKGSYLASILNGTGPIVEGYIRNDFALPALRESVRDREEAQAEALAARKQLAEAQEQLANVQRQTKEVFRELETYRRELEGIMRRASKLAEGSL
jgi:hypothetical protein